MADKAEDVKIGGLSLGKSAFAVVLVFFIAVGIPLANFYWKASDKSEASEEKTRLEAAEKTARTLLVEGHTREIVILTEAKTKHDVEIEAMAKEIVRLTELTNRLVETVSRLSGEVAINTSEHKDQKTRATQRAKDHTFRDLRHDTHDVEIEAMARIQAQMRDILIKQGLGPIDVYVPKRPVPEITNKGLGAQ